MFRRIRCLSPHVHFSNASDVFVNTSGTFSPMHIDIGMTSGFSTMIDGAKLFVLYGCNDHNRRIMQRCHLHPVDWSGALRLMRELTEPRVVYLKPGDTIYVGAGQPHFVLSPKPGALVTLNCANPSISEWDNTLKGYDSLITGICNFLSVQGLSQLEGAIGDLGIGLGMWRSVRAPLQRQENVDSVAQWEVDAFIKKQEEGRTRVLETYKRLGGTKSFDDDNEEREEEEEEQPVRSAPRKRAKATRRSLADDPLDADYEPSTSRSKQKQKRR
jgi:hypothetical protein